MTDAKRRWFQPLLIVIVLVVCVWGMLQLMQSRVKPAKQKPQAVTQAEPVAINKIQRGSYPVVVSGWGLVSAKTQHRLIARVSGDIETQADALFSGRRFKAGESLLGIAEQEYRLKMAIERAVLEEARLNLATEQGRALIAKQDWQGADPLLMQNLRQDLPVNQSLVFREAHLAQRQAALEAAQSRVALAEMDLKRTRITAPCEGVWLGEALGIGQFVSAGSEVGRFACAEAAHVTLSVPRDTLKWFVKYQTAKPTVVKVAGYDARFLGWVPQLDAEAKMLPVMLELAKPFEYDHPVLLQEQVPVEIVFPEIQHIYRIPETALKHNQSVWRVVEQPDGESRLRIQPVDIIAREAAHALVRIGAKSGGANKGSGTGSDTGSNTQSVTEQDAQLSLVVNPIPHAYEGMPVRVVSEVFDQLAVGGSS